MALSVCSMRSSPLRIASPGSEKWNMTPSPSLHRPAAVGESRILNDAREVRGDLGGSAIAALLRERRVAREIEERDRRRAPRVARGNAALLRKRLGKEMGTR
jgi:hypothetical protein